MQIGSCFPPATRSRATSRARKRYRVWPAPSSTLAPVRCWCRTGLWSRTPRPASRLRPSQGRPEARPCRGAAPRHAGVSRRHVGDAQRLPGLLGAVLNHWSRRGALRDGRSGSRDGARLTVTSPVFLRHRTSVGALDRRVGHVAEHVRVNRKWSARSWGLWRRISGGFTLPNPRSLPAAPPAIQGS
jgi:hypothetical protein